MIPTKVRLPEPNIPVRVWLLDTSDLKTAGEWHGYHDGSAWILPGMHLGRRRVAYWEPIPGEKIALLA